MTIDGRLTDLQREQDQHQLPGLVHPTLGLQLVPFVGDEVGPPNAHLYTTASSDVSVHTATLREDLCIQRGGSSSRQQWTNTRC